MIKKKGVRLYCYKCDGWPLEEYRRAAGVLEVGEVDSPDNSWLSKEGEWNEDICPTCGTKGLYRLTSLAASVRWRKALRIQKEENAKCK